ncbi:MAG: GTPase HflX [Oscillospiraceae bacterium]|nr:GTPase HflX [Oscillospiraceae bacterium]
MPRKIHETSKPEQTSAILVGISFERDKSEAAEISLAELEELAKTAGASVFATVIQRRKSLDAATAIGQGKLEEIKQLAESDADSDILLIFDCELSAGQIRNIEKATERRTIDRTMLILDIFAGRAKSREGKLQVELAQLKYRLPRLAGLGTSLSRLGGGIGTRGPGETKLESDKRHIRRRIEKLTDELRELETRRGYSRTRRKKDGVITAAIVGYTNAGKSTLLNALTNADTLAEDRLFATLDPLSRNVSLPDGRNIMLVDTVGLIRRLPHHLIQAFKSTLEEAAAADIILHVCDAADPEYREKAEVTAKLLAELGAAEIPVIVVLNKCDLIDSGNMTDNSGEPRLKVSAKTGAGLEQLLSIISHNL